MFHEVEVSNLMFNKTSEDRIDFKKYDINVELEEQSSSDQKTVLKYSLDLTSNPKNSVINISGNAILNGEQEEIEQMLKQDEQNTPQIVSLIYQELFPLMYIISKNMKIPSPAHTISQNAISENQDLVSNQENDVIEEEKVMDSNVSADDNENVSEEIKPENEEGDNLETKTNENSQ